MSLRVGGLHHLALKTPNPRRLAAFYRDVLLLEEQVRHVDADGLRSVWLKLGDGILMIERAAGDETQPASDLSGWHLLALRIERNERDRWVERLASAGHRLRSSTSFTLYFLDPEGHRVALSHWPLPAESEPPELSGDLRR